jgi:endonuclease YncB( thermonuclease family)
MSFLLLLAGVVARGAAFTCTPVAVWDGDGPIWCAEGPRIRLSGIAAREIDESCKPGHPCPAGSGKAARDHLVALLGGARERLKTGHVTVRAPGMRCTSMGSGKGDRTAALCMAQHVGDLSCAMVRSGHALRWRRYGGDRLC